MIIVNNGSTEDVEGILKNYSDERIRYIRHEKMLPIIENWNKCLSYAKGEYFVLFSDDDIYEKEFLEELHSLSVKYPTLNIFHTRVRVINEKNETSYLTASCPEYETAVDFVWHRLKSYRMHYAPDFMCKTKTLKKVGGFVDLPNAWGSDDATWFLMANEGGIVASAKVLCNWRESGINLTKKGSTEEKLIAVDAFKKWLRAFIENKINLRENESDLLIEVKKIFDQRIGVQQAIALKLGSESSKVKYLMILWSWFKYRNKFSLRIFSLVWGMMLLAKQSQLRQN